MRTDFPTPELELIALGDHDRQDYWQVLVENGSGTLVDLSDRVKRIVHTPPSPQQSIGTCDVAFWREGAAGYRESLSPYMAESSYNRLNDGVTYSPLLALGRRFVVRSIVVPRGAARPSSGYHEVHSGRIDTVSCPEQYGDAEISGRDQAGDLMEESIETKQVYKAGTLISAAMQEVLSNNRFGHITLYVPVPNDQVLGADVEYNQIKVWDALWGLASSTGWVCTYRYDSDGVARLTYYSPQRTKTVPDAILTPTRLGPIPGLSETVEDIRGVVVGSCVGMNGEPIELTVEDPASIARYGGVRRAMFLTEGSDSSIRSLESLADYLNAALSDCSDPDAEIRAEAPYFPLCEPAVDLYTLTSNGVLWDGDANWAPVTVQHTAEAGGLTTSAITFRGKPSGGRAMWRGRDNGTPVGDKAYEIWGITEGDEDPVTGLARREWQRGARVVRVDVWTAVGPREVDAIAVGEFAAAVEGANHFYFRRPKADELLSFALIPYARIGDAWRQLGQIRRGTIEPPSPLAPSVEPLVVINEAQTALTLSLRIVSPRGEDVRAEWRTGDADDAPLLSSAYAVSGSTFLLGTYPLSRDNVGRVKYRGRGLESQAVSTWGTTPLNPRGVAYLDDASASYDPASGKIVARAVGGAYCANLRVRISDDHDFGSPAVVVTVPIADGGTVEVQSEVIGTEGQGQPWYVEFVARNASGGASTPIIKQLDVPDRTARITGASTTLQPGEWYEVEFAANDQAQWTEWAASEAGPWTKVDDYNASTRLGRVGEDVEAFQAATTVKRVYLRGRNAAHPGGEAGPAYPVGLSRRGPTITPQLASVEVAAGDPGTCGSQGMENVVSWTVTDGPATGYSITVTRYTAEGGADINVGTGLSAETGSLTDEITSRVEDLLGTPEDYYYRVTLLASGVVRAAPYTNTIRRFVSACL